MLGVCHKLACNCMFYQLAVPRKNILQVQCSFLGRDEVRVKLSTFQAEFHLVKFLYFHSLTTIFRS